MKARINNQIFKYETERDVLKDKKNRTVAEECRLQTVTEIVKVLYELRR